VADADLAYAGIAELAPRIASGELSPVELTEVVLERIGRLNPKLHAYITVTAEAARRAAEEAAREIAGGRHRGPLHGIPIAVKDAFVTEGVRTTFGSLLHQDDVPGHDAALVERLKVAGAVLLGKTNLHEVTIGTTSANPHFGWARNPWNPDCHPGGSSGGSAAALAAGMAHGSIGGDTGGSIRQPAACCGVVGLKPTYGLLSKYGSYPVAWSLDHVGPMTRTVRDAALMLKALAGHDPRDPASLDRPPSDYTAGLAGDIRGWRIGVSRRYHFEACDPEVLDAVEAAIERLRDLGAKVQEIELPDMQAAHAAGTVILFSEAAAYHAADLRARPEAYSGAMRDLLEVGGLFTAAQYLSAQRLRRRLAEETAQAMADLDAILLPTSPVPATPIEPDVPEHAVLRGRNCISFNVVSLPAVSVPCGFTRAGLPVGLQIVGHAFDEAGVLAIAHAYEQATDWHERRPLFAE
jgi:aspartyl-tRNA(Asn)/glutamyl-tRNA(Gln) amidotransferase subunit A